MDRNGAFADSRSYPLDIARPNITDGEITQRARFQHLRNAGRSLPQWFSDCIQIVPRDDKSFAFIAPTLFRNRWLVYPLV